jgi:hypothetical protein
LRLWWRWSAALRGPPARLSWGGRATAPESGPEPAARIGCEGAGEASAVRSGVGVTAASECFIGKAWRGWDWRG